jgi:hypothetical protein
MLMVLFLIRLAGLCSKMHFLTQSLKPYIRLDNATLRRFLQMGSQLFLITSFAYANIEDCNKCASTTQM